MYIYIVLILWEKKLSGQLKKASATCICPKEGAYPKDSNYTEQ